jgi:peptidoglycan/xylan/chitin deacetylase (PgdA/CDA1 family)
MTTAASFIRLNYMDKGDWRKIICMAKRWAFVLIMALLLIVGVMALAKQPADPAPTETPVPNFTPQATSTLTRTLNVPILMYHHVGNPGVVQTYSVDQAMFEWQMDYLEQQGYHTVSLDDIATALATGSSLPDKPVAITFDDGWALQITDTLQVLLRHHFRATYYIIVDVTGKRAATMTWDQVRQLRDAGMWIGSHTLTHTYLPGASETRLRDELLGSKQTLEQELGIPITSVAYPGGSFNARVERMAQEAGYATAVTVIKGYAQRADQMYRLQRVGVYGVDTQERFIAKVDETFFHKSWPLPSGQARLSMPALSPTPKPSTSHVP